MAQNNNILQELRELESSLANMAVQNTYSVPEGYFEGLAAQVLRRIKAMEAATAGEELNFLSPVIGSLPKQVPYTVPAGYFDTLPENTIQLIREIGLSAKEETAALSTLLNEVNRQMPYSVPQGYFAEVEQRMLKTVTGEDQTAKEELESISPLLSGLKKEMPFSVPQGYFENMAAGKPGENQTAKVISFSSRKWFKYAAAAILVGVIATTAVLLIKKEAIDPDKNSFAWIEKNTKKVSTDEIENFIKLTDETLGQKEVLVNADKLVEVKDLIKDIPEKDIQDFLDDLPFEENNSATDEDIMMN